MLKEELFKMKHGEEKWTGSMGVRRVFGGWIYMFHDAKTDTITSSVFVPEELNCNIKNR